MNKSTPYIANIANYRQQTNTKHITITITITNIYSSTSLTASSAVSRITSPSRVSYFGPPPLVDGEDEGAYNELLLQISSAVGPSDFIEEMWVRDVLDLTWEIHRWRQLKANLISIGVAALLKPKLAKVIKTDQEVNDLIALWVARDPSAISRVNECLALTGDKLECLATNVVGERLGYFRRLEELTTQAEWRRNATLREIDRHRAVLAQRLRDAVQQAEDAKFKTIEQKAIPQSEFDS